MTREEAIKKVRWGLLGLVIDKDVHNAFETLIPELAESEDERIRKEIIKFIQDFCNPCDPDCDKWIAYLEKQEENIEKEYVFRPLAGTDITIAAEQAIRRVNEGDRLVLAFNGAYIPVIKGCDANKIVDIYDTFIEKQKEANKAIEAVERIDKYIDEHLANAHDMKDSNPDKKYYRGWDDALGKMAGILQDVYSGEKQKETLHISETCKENADSFTDEDERIRKSLIGFVEQFMADDRKEKTLAWLEKQKEQPTNEEMLRTLRAEYEKGVADTIAKYEQKEQKEIPLMNGDADLYFDEWNQQNQNPTKRQCFEEGMKYAQRLQKEQKPLSTEETELNSIAFLEQMGYTCIPPRKEQKQGWSEDFDEEVEKIHKRYPEVSFAKLTRIAYHFSKWANRCKDIEWSNEDEEKLKAICTYLRDYSRLAKLSDKLRFNEYCDFLESLRLPQDRCKDCPHRGDMFLLTQGIKSGKHELASEFMNYLDENRPYGKMGLSNAECEDIDKAFKENDWAKIMRYVEKYHSSWKPSEEQIKALWKIMKYAVSLSSYYGIQKEIESLYEDLVTRKEGVAPMKEIEE